MDHAVSLGSQATTLRAGLEGIGLVGPGLDGWTLSAGLLTGASPYVSRPTVLPAPELLPPAERRRVGRVVKLALAAGLQATVSARVDAAELPAVFSSSGGDGQNCHEICLSLTQINPQISPTRFHNSVHNAAAGYWSIATGAREPSNALCAHDASFAAGLLEAMAQVVVERTAVLLVAYDAPYPPPLSLRRPIPDAFGVAFVLTPQGGAGSLAELAISLEDETADRMADTALETLRASIPAARCLPLLERLARRQNGRVRLDYMDRRCVAIEVSACR